MVTVSGVSDVATDMRNVPEGGALAPADTKKLKINLIRKLHCPVNKRLNSK